MSHAGPSTETAAPAAAETVTETTAEPSIDDVIAAAMNDLPAEEKQAEPAKPDPVDEKRKADLSKDGKLDEGKLSAAFAKVREQERRAKARAQQLEADRQAILAARKEVDDARAQEEPIRALAKSNPIEYLKKQGWTKQQIADFIINDEKLTPEHLVADMDARVKAQLEDLDRRQREFAENVEKQRVQAKAAEYESLVLTQISTQIDAYPLTKRMASRPGEDLHKATLNYLARVYRDEGKALAPKDALEYFENRFREERDALSDPPGQAGTVPTGKPGAGQPRALTNGDTSERGVNPLPEDSDEAR